MTTDWQTIYKNKKVLITGHTGFKGSWLAIWLAKLGADVIGYSLDPISDKCLFELAELSNKMKDIRGDIRDAVKLQAVFEQYQPEIVFHLAAQPLVKQSYRDPVYTYEVNVMGTMNVLEAIRKTPSVKAGIMVTSDKCYENKEWVWGYRETDPMGGYDPYSSSKGCCELLISSYQHSFFPIDSYNKHGKLIASVRAGNVIGGGDWSENRIIPDCVRSLLSGQSIKVRSPQSVRPWQHVLEPLSGYLKIGAYLYKGKTQYAEGWNFGPESDSVTTVQQLVEKIVLQWKEGTWEVDTSHSTEHEAKLLSLDINKAKHNLAWYPKWDIDQTVYYTIEWYKLYKEVDVYELCLKQISNYEK
ncbi:CDP-glucose 4,6-dehydratase [Bacillus sp. 522_BSPC]|uniref:CDP-glucose 4,6-dehydratase n=1 Tax=Bacillus sp. 522_BSPC TaxID=1579338 RepID=UPI00066058B4|nr:CDP-glucose 4,6-dehydratase [Bacillus sp. 522_BSPC]